VLRFISRGLRTSISSENEMSGRGRTAHHRRPGDHQDPNIDIVIELMGGYEPARTFILDAMRQKKHVVTANKALLAIHGDEIFQNALRQGVNIGFEASVGGTIPIIKTVRESLIGTGSGDFCHFERTSNLILSKMTDEGKPFDVVLKEAQSLGFAEADPTYDVEGIDAAHKLAILLSLAYGKKVRLEDIYREGISKLALKTSNLHEN